MENAEKVIFMKKIDIPNKFDRNNNCTSCSSNSFTKYSYTSKKVKSKIMLKDNPSIYSLKSQFRHLDNNSYRNQCNTPRLFLGFANENDKESLEKTQGKFSGKIISNKIKGIQINFYNKEKINKKTSNIRDYSCPRILNNLSKINCEIQKIHQFIKNSPINISDEKLIEDLKIRRFNPTKNKIISFTQKNSIQLQPRLFNSLRNKKTKPNSLSHLKNNKDRCKKNSSNDDTLSTEPINKKAVKKIQFDENKIQQLLSKINNPCFGLEQIAKTYPKYMKNHSIKINCTFKERYNSKALRTALISLRNDNKSLHNQYISTNKKKLTNEAKLKLKCKLINWFIENKKDLLNKLLDENFKDVILKFCEKKYREFGCGISIEEFGKLLQNNNITKDPEIIQKLFWIFDDDGDNDLRYNEIFAGISMFKEDTPAEKIKNLFELCDEDHSGTVSKNEFYNLLKKNIIDLNDEVILKKIVDNIFSKNGDIELSFDQFYREYLDQPLFEKIINKNMLNLKIIDASTDDNIKRELNKINLERNLFIKEKIIGMSSTVCPVRNLKFINIVNEFANTKEYLKKNESRKLDLDESISDN